MTQLPVLLGGDAESIPREISEGDLDDVILSLRNAIAKLSAGDTTLSFGILTQTSRQPLFTLGSKGRFYHPEFGIIGATYVRFGSAIPEVDAGSPVGFYRQQSKFLWEVTPFLADSSPALALGLAGAYGAVESGAHGWVITNGINIQSVKTNLTSLPIGNARLGWVADGTLGLEANSTLGFIAAKSKLAGFPNSSISPAGFFLDAGGGQAEQAEIDSSLAARITALEASARGSLARDDFTEFRQIVNEQILTLNRTAGITSQTRLVETVNESLAAIERTLFAAATFQNLAATDAANAQAAATNSETSLLAINRESQLVRAYRDASGFNVEASREASLQAQLSNNESLVNAIASSAASVSASASAANASSSAILAASIGPNLINPNSEFRDYPWDGIAANPLPAQWTNWELEAPNTRSRILSVRGGFAIRDVQVTSDSHIGVRMPEQIPPLDVFSSGQYVYEMDLYLESGTFAGTGGYVNFYDAAGVGIGNQAIPIPAPIGSPRVLNRIYRFRTPVIVPAGTASIDIHALTSWRGFSPSSPKTVQWLRCGIRAASQGEIDGLASVGGLIAANAAIVAESVARVNAITAETLARTSADSTFTTGLATTNGRVDSEIVTRGTGDSALAASISSLSASVSTQNGIFDASISSQGIAIANLNGASATFQTIVAATGSQPAQVALKAGLGGSLIDLVAQRIMVGDYTALGVVREIARFENGQAILNDALIRNLQVAPHPDATVFFGVELKPKIFLAADGDVVSFGGTLVNLPRIVADKSSIPTAAGEIVDAHATGISATQFTAYAKRVTPSAPTNETATGYVLVSGATPLWQADKPTVSDATGGFYQFRFSGNLPVISTFLEPPFRFNTFEGTFDFYLFSGGLWILVASETFTLESTTSSGAPAPAYSGLMNLSFTLASNLPVGQIGGKEFGLHPRGTALIGALTSITYTTQTMGAVTSIPNLIPYYVYP